MNHQYEQEIQRCTQMIQTSQPTNDIVANIISQQFNDRLGTTITINYDDNDSRAGQNDKLETSFTTSSIQHPYPPINQTGLVEDHDRPYADYGHFNRETIAQECQFNLQVPTMTTITMMNKHHSIRMNTKSFAITSWTNVSKDSMVNEIKREFGIENIQ